MAHELANSSMPSSANLLRSPGLSPAARADRRRWSRPPLLRSPPKDSVLASYAINESSDESDNDVVAPLESGEESQAKLAQSLLQLKHNFARLSQEKAQMQGYCEEMEKTMENKEEMVTILRSQNSMLSQKLGRSQSLAGQQRAELESELLEEQNTSAILRRRKRQLPSVPVRGGSSEDVIPEKKKYVVELLEKQVAELQQQKQVMQDKLDEAETQIEKTADIANEFDEYRQAHPDDRNSKGEVLEEQLAREQELQTYKSTIAELTETNSILQDSLDESTYLTETLRKRQQEAEQQLAEQSADTSLSAELSILSELDPLVNTDDKAELEAEVASLKKSLGDAQASCKSIQQKHNDTLQALQEAHAQASKASASYVELKRSKESELLAAATEAAASKQATQTDSQKSATALERRLEAAEDAANRAQERLEAENKEHNAALQEYEEENQSLCDAYNAAVTESAQLKEQIVTLESKKQFKGMTVSEQAIMFDEKVHLISRHDELQDELVNAKITIGKITWQREHERVYRQERNKLIYRILKRAISVQDREQVIEMLRATEEDSTQGSVANPSAIVDDGTNMVGWTMVENDAQQQSVSGEDASNGNSGAVDGILE